MGLILINWANCLLLRFSWGETALQRNFTRPSQLRIFVKGQKIRHAVSFLKLYKTTKSTQMQTNNGTKCYVNSMNRNRQIEGKMVAHDPLRTICFVTAQNSSQEHHGLSLSSSSDELFGDQGSYYDLTLYYGSSLPFFGHLKGLCHGSPVHFV